MQCVHCLIKNRDVFTFNEQYTAQRVWINSLRTECKFHTEPFTPGLLHSLGQLRQWHEIGRGAHCLFPVCIMGTQCGYSSASLDWKKSKCGGEGVAL